MNAGELAQERAFASYFRWVRRTSRIRMDDDLGRSAVVGVWSESVFSLMVAAMGRPNIAVFVLHHRGVDGMIRLMDRLGLRVIIAGSGGADGVREARAWLSEPNRVLAVTVDGPKGPFRVVKAGVVRLARMFRAPLFPVTVSAWSFSEPDDVGCIPYGHGEITVAPLAAVPEGFSPFEGAERIQRAMSAVEDVTAGRRPGALWSKVSTSWVRACRMPLFTDRVTFAGNVVNETSPPGFP
jgi:lysophospholipid acyltransferase (LPLAT)-like uncharacterized protein